MVVVTLGCVMLIGFSSAWVIYERRRLQHKEETAQYLRGRGVSLYGPRGGWPRPRHKMQTWRGNETYDYIKVCSIVPGYEEFTELDLHVLRTNFPGIQRIDVHQDSVSPDLLRKLAAFPHLKELTLLEVPLSQDESAWFRETVPQVKVEQLRYRRPSESLAEYEQDRLKRRKLELKRELPNSSAPAPNPAKE